MTAKTLRRVARWHLACVVISVATLLTALAGLAFAATSCWWIATAIPAAVALVILAWDGLSDDRRSTAA